MRRHLFCWLIVFFGAVSAFGVALPSCRTNLFSRHGDRIDITLNSLEHIINQRVESSHSHFTDLQLSAEGNDALKISGRKDDTPMSISGPVKVSSDGRVVVHAAHITKNGTGVKSMMDLFGKDLADYVDLKGTKAISVKDDDLRIDPRRLLHVAGQVKSVRLTGSGVEMVFASQPCR